MWGRFRRGVSDTLNGTLAILIALGCPIAFCLYFWPHLLVRVDNNLSAARPLVVEALTIVLQRPVKIGRISVDLSISTVQTILRHPERYENYPILLDDLELGARPEELAAVGQPWVVRVRQARVTLSVPSALRGDFVTQGVKLLELNQPEVVVVRDPKGKINLTQLVPEAQVRPDPTKPPFQTEVIVRDGRVRVRDFASLRAPGRLEENFFQKIAANAKLSGPRQVRFIARLTPDGPTRAHLRAPLLVSGSLRRSDPTPRADSPTLEEPRLRAHVDCLDLDAVYGLSYVQKLPPNLRFTRGQAEVHADLLLPGAPGAALQARGEARFRDVDVEVRSPVAVRVQAAGTLAYANNQLSTNLSGTVFGEPFQARANVLLTSPTHPTVDLSASMPRIPLQRVLRSVPELKLPPELTLGPTARLEGITAQGTLDNPNITAHIGGVSARWKGLPPVSDASADLTYRDGELQATTLRGTIPGGGTVTGRGRFRVAQANGRLLPPTQRTGVFEARVRNVRAEQLAPLQALKTPPRGNLSADVQGSLRGTRLTATGLVQAQNLRVAGLDFTTASARVALENQRFEVTEGVVGGTMGSVQVRGSGMLGGNLALEGNLVGVDLGQLATAFGLPGLEGTLSASATVSGKTDTPTVQLRDITVLQPSYRVDNRQFVGDAAYAERATLRLLGTGQIRAELDKMEPLRLYHAPAVATVYGTVTGGRDAARLNLTANAENIEIEELVNQASEEPGRFAPPWLRRTPGYLPLLADLDWSGQPRVPASGRIRSVTATLTGDASNPKIQGEANLGRLLLFSFPLDGGTLSFSQEDRNLRLYDLTLKTATGTITGEAGIQANGALTGTLVADMLDLQALSSLSGLADRQLGITGTLDARLTLSGTRDKPLLLARVNAVKPIEIAGIPLADLAIGEIQVEPEIREGQALRGDVRLPALTARLASSDGTETAARLAVSNLRYNLETQSFSGDVSFTEARFQKLAALLRRGHFDATPSGQAFVSRLYELPNNVDATANLTASLSGRMTSVGLRDRRARVQLTSDDIQIGTANDPQRHLEGKLALRASLEDEILTLESLNLTQTGAADDEPASIRALPHPRRNPTTGETVNQRSWLRLPYDSKEPVEYHVTLDANAVPMELGRLLDPEFPVQGRATLTVGADGTQEKPSITASFYANNLLVGKTVGKAGTFNRPPLTLDVARFQVDLRGTSTSDWNIVLSDGLLTHEKEKLTFDGVMPFNPKDSRVAANRPISLSVSSEEGIALTTLAQYVDVHGVQLEGALRGRVALTGTLNDPLLGGKVELQRVAARFPSPAQRPGRDVLNPIRSLDVTAELAGREIRFPQATLTMAALPSRPRTTTKDSKPATVNIATLPAAGTVALDPSSVIRIDNLEDFTRLFMGNDDNAPKPKLRGEFNLLARFNGFQVDSDNVSSLLMGTEPPRSLGLGEALAGRLDGQLRIQGPLLTPTIATPANTKLVLSNVVFQVPRNDVPEVTSKKSLVFNPHFGIEVATGTEAKLVNQTTVAGLNKLLGYQFQGTGTVSIGGDLAAPRIDGALVPTGGYYDYPLARFNVQRGGEIRLTYARRFQGDEGQGQFDIRLTDVYAEAKITVTPSAISSARNTPRSTDLTMIGGGLSDESLVGKRVRVTARFNGLLQMGGDGSAATTAPSTEPTTLPIELSSDSNLSPDEIRSLLFPADLLVKAIFNNGSQQFIRDSISLLGTSLSSRYLLDPFTSQIRDLFGLDSFTVDYDFNGQANLFLSRRLAPPLDRVTIEVRRSFQTRALTGAQLSQYYSINYELLQLRKGTRLQIGVSTNEQRDNQFFLRGTLRF